MPNQTGMFNVPQIQDRLAGMSQQQLFQEGQANQNDALMFSLVNNENMNRQKAKAALMAQQAGQQQPPVKQQDLMAMAPQPNKVPSVPTNMGAGIPLQGPGSPQQMGQNQLPEEQGIGALPANNLQSMAGGGITGYDEGGTTIFTRCVYITLCICNKHKSWDCPLLLLMVSSPTSHNITPTQNQKQALLVSGSWRQTLLKDMV